MHILGLKVFGVTAVFSILAYLWLIVVLMGVSKDVVSVIYQFQSQMETIDFKLQSIRLFY